MGQWKSGFCRRHKIKWQWTSFHWEPFFVFSNQLSKLLIIHTRLSVLIIVLRMLLFSVYVWMFNTILNLYCKWMDEKFSFTSLYSFVLKIIPNVWTMHHSDKYWDEPFSFKPERFLDEDGQLLPATHPVRKRYSM